MTPISDTARRPADDASVRAKLGDFTVDVDTDDAKVRVYCE